MNQTVAVELKGITKTFGTVVANEKVNLTVQKGEIHALLGENGAGKSTLVNMLSGLYSPDGGYIYIRGKRVQLTSPKQAIEYGIGMVHQHFKLVESFTAKENIIAGKRDTWFTTHKHIEDKILSLCEKYDLKVELSKRVEDMSVGEKQMLEIIKVLYQGADILILDEPTAVLTPQEVERLFNIIRKMKEQDCAVILITHKLHEVMAICDKVSVLRRGENVATVKIAETTPTQLVELMVGRPTDLAIQNYKVAFGEPIYKVNNLTVKDKENVSVLDQVSFVMNTGEILGVAGVAGSGQKELCEALCGISKISSGELIFKEQHLEGKSPREIYNRGIHIGFVPEDRLGMGLVGNMGIVDNLLLKEYYIQQGLLVNRKGLKDKANNLIHTLEVKTPGIDHPVKQLSGGNIQKVLIGRELALSPDVLVTSYPVRGLDIGAAYQIYDLLNKEKQKGVSILFVGEDLDVLMQISDRILVLCDGKVTGLVNAREITKEALGLMMAGHVQEEGGDYSGNKSYKNA